MNIYGAMNTAKWALLTHQAAIEVTGQNIANVSNPDYTRQEIFLEASNPVQLGNHFMGTGVRLAGVERRFDKYMYYQRLQSSYLLAGWEARERLMDRLDIVLNETGSSGISTEISEMFQSFYNLAIKPSGAVERQDVIEKGKTLSQKIAYVGNELKRLRRDIDIKITGAIPTINRITDEIVSLNKIIHETEVNGSIANDYRDRREALLMDLSEITDVSYFEQSNNELVVMLSNSRPLVIGQSKHNLSANTNSTDPETSSIFWEDAAGNLTNISSEFSSGQLGEWMTLRDSDIIDIQNNLDTLAASIIKEVNRVHATGYGLDGSTGNNFFNGLTPGGRTGIYNTGTGVLQSGSVLNPELVDLDHYRLTFDGAGNYSVYNIDEGAASGTFSFASGSALTFFQQRGISISIIGTPASGDTFDISASDDAAFNMAVNSQVSGNTDRVAAGATTLRGDGQQARRMADLQYMKKIGGAWDPTGTASGFYTFDDFLGSLVGGVGSSVQQAKSGRKLQEAIDNQLLNLRESLSGVSLDEEMVNLIKFQHAYGAAAKMITTVDEMLQTLINLK